MKRIYKISILILVSMLFFRSELVQIHAAAAAFYVQTAAAVDDRTIEVSIYLDDADNLGGIDAELLYDPQKVTFISSSFGATLSSIYSDIYHDEENGVVHYVILYPEAVDAHGVLINVIFELREGESYQPQFTVNDLIDNTENLNDIPYTVFYQQANGTMTGSRDTSGVLADEKIVQKTLEEYGAEEDMEINSNLATEGNEPVNGTDYQGQTDSQDTENPDKYTQSNEENSREPDNSDKETELNEGDVQKETDDKKNGKTAIYIMAGMLSAAVTGFLVVKINKRKQKKD